ncbi:MAG: tRNA pseudouridine(55) synthase TruB [Commensalibacter sp.]
MRNRRGQELDGWIVVDKPVGVTSTFVVNKVKRVFNARKAGHSGTLDPLASGILPIAFGKATKTIPYVMDEMKIYHFTLTFGEARETDDAEGAVTQRSDVRPSDLEISEALKAFQGDILQIPPIFSAIHVNGQRAYDLARKGETPNMTPRHAYIDRFRMINRNSLDEAEFEVISGKGVYMRSLARDLAVACGSVGYISRLRRLKVGPFGIDKAISLDKIVETDEKAFASTKMILPVETALDDIPALALTTSEVIDLKYGRSIDLSHNEDRFLQKDCAQQHNIIRAMSGEQLVGLCRLDDGWLRPVRLF